MSSEKIEAQEFAVRILKTHLKKNRLAHTYLITGKENPSQEEIALSFAAALNCEKGNYFQDCDCIPCRKTFARNHPDVTWLGADEKARSIKIEEVRNALGAASLKPYEGKWKVFILMNADRLTGDAANALLKTLEEPPAHTLFILLVETKAHLLETIQSRSFEIRLRPLADGGARDSEKNKILEGVGRKNWEDFLDTYQGKTREELKDILESLAQYFLDEIQRGNPASSVDAIDYVLETKQAVDENVNQKLALSRLSMRLRNILPLNQ